MRRKKSQAFMVKILSLIPYNVFPPKTGGQNAIVLFHEYLAEETELLTVTVKSNKPDYAKGYQILNILPDTSFRYINPFHFFTFRRLIKSGKPVFLLLEQPYFGWLGVLLKTFTGVKLIIRSLNIEGYRFKTLKKWWWRILLAYEKFTHRNADYSFFIQDADREFAITNFKLDPATCSTITYGITWEHPPTTIEKNNSQAILRRENNIEKEDQIFLFVGSLDYSPNLEALDTILEKINPLLLARGFKYKIVICGRGLPDQYNALKSYADKNIIYRGFVDDIGAYFKGTDVFINPVIEGGGIKTKLVEALGYSTRSISTENGAIGIDPEVTGGLLTIIPGEDWTQFAEAMIGSEKLPQVTIPPVFFQTFYWKNIVKKVVSLIQQKPFPH